MLEEFNFFTQSSKLCQATVIARTKRPPRALEVLVIIEILPTMLNGVNIEHTFQSRRNICLILFVSIFNIKHCRTSITQV